VPCEPGFNAPTEVRVRIKDGAQWSAIAIGSATGTPSTISLSDSTFGEGDGEVEVNLLITPPSTVPLSVSVHTRPVTAQGGRDFYGFTKTIEIAAGTGQAGVRLSILDDTETESTETLQLKLFNAEGAAIDADTATVTITDNDSGPAPQLSVEDLVVGEADATASVIVRLSSPATTPIAVSVHTRSETARGGEDYYGFTRTLNFTPGELSLRGLALKMTMLRSRIQSSTLPTSW